MRTLDPIHCPCCGFKASIRGGGCRHKVGQLPGSVYCPRCGIETRTGDLDTQIAIWNSRVNVKENNDVQR